MNSFSQTLLTSLLISAVALLVLITRKKYVRNWQPISVLIILFIANDLISRAGLWLQSDLFPGLGWNWTGKILSLLFSIGFVVFYKGISWRDVFGVANFNRKSVLSCLLVFGLLMVIKVIPNFLSEEKEFISNEQLLFQATLPGLQEEFLFRGIYFALLAIAIVPVPQGSRSRWFHLDVIIIALLFGLAHSLSVGGSKQFINMNWLAFGSAFISGLCYTWLRIISRSVIVPMVTHNVINVAICIVQLLK